ncbi:cyclin-dependent kinase 11B isoform X6 [Acanthopagrus latus]|uniref:cyclin-dependent kinase 11B isoform X6 n=1 Tax=Acanthopagrus latus TaxID=8177 RepID=UPI00187BEED6|nr:cyclin-dependent kinase 11B isoform X6 [Acanthopagrus latus]
MGDEKETWKVKTLDEILQEKKRRRELEERTDPKRQKNFSQGLVPQADDREAKRDTPEEGELRDQRMEITIRNSPYTREDSTEDRGEEDESLAIKPPQQIARKDKSHHRKEEKRKDKRRHRSHSAEGGKHARPKDKEKERESERRKRQWEEDKARRDWERQKRREQARAHSRRERDRLEQIERQRERDRKLREQQKEQRELKDRERRADERRKERDARRDVPSHHRMLPDEYDDKPKQSHRSRSPTHVSRDRSEHNEPRKSATASKEEKPEGKDLLADLQDISDSERKTSTAESSIVSGSGSDEEEDDDDDEEDSSSQSEGEEEGEEESGSGSGRSEQSAEDVSEDEQSDDDFEDERENGNHIPAVPESRFDHDSEESGEDMEEEEEDDEEAGDGDPTPQSQTHSRSPTPEENYIPDSPPISPVELKKELPKYLPALQGCRSVEEFQCLNRIEEGTYGVVYRAKDKKTDEIVALKRLKMEKEKEGFPITSLREINTILKAQHPNIVTVREIVVGSNMDKIYIVMNYVEHDLKSLMETMKQPFLPGEVKTLMIQLLRGVRHLHDNWILHRDLKTSNLLLSHKGILKIGDFGLAREYGSPLKPYTPVVVTLWYRSPELLLGAKEYSTAVDMWSVGCIFGELLTQKPLFPGKSEIDQINKIFKDLGSPSEKIWPGYSELPAVKKMTFTEYPYNNLRKRFGALLSDQGFDLMNKFLTYCPSKRILSDEGLKHEYFRETPLPIDPSMFPTWPAKSEQQRVKRGTSPRPPEGGLGYSHLGDDDLKDTGFHLTTSNQGASAVGPGFSLKF